MKKYCFTIVVLTFGFFFQGCEKEETLTSHSSKSHKEKSIKSKNSGIDPTNLFNPNNPYDSYGLNLNYLYEDLEVVFDTPGLTIDQLELEVENIISSNSDITYPSVDTAGYVLLEAEVLGDFINETNIDNLVSNSLDVESSIINSTSLNQAQKNRLLALVSQYKYNYLYCYELYNRTLKANFQACMRREAGDVFNDDNPVDDILFITGIPGSFFGMAAYCAYEAASLGPVGM